MLLRVVHETRYHYQTPVVLAQHVAHLRPSDGPNQRVIQHALDIQPAPAHREDCTDAFGNAQTFFSLESPHETLMVMATCLIETCPPQPLDTSPAWETVRDHHRYRLGAPYDPATEFTFASPFVIRHDEFTQLALRVFTPQRPILDACAALCQQMHLELTYETDSTAINTPALEALRQRKGVCQDFAHIMIACLRSLGLPARYVSGYLLTQPPPGQARLIGADASHAWVSVHVNDRWYDFDPTNHRYGRESPGDDYVKLAHGRDFGDVSPLRGVIQGGGAHHLTVAVTVAPSGDFPLSNTP